MSELSLPDSFSIPTLSLIGCIVGFGAVGLSAAGSLSSNSTGAHRDGSRGPSRPLQSR
jgi:hypothetical protein